MDMRNIIEYIEAGLRINPNESRKHAIGPVCFALLCTFGQGIILGDGWCVASCIMLALSIILWITVIILSVKKTVDNYVTIKALISTSFYLQTVFTQVFYYKMINGFNVITVAICVFPLAIPMFLALKNLRQLNKGIKLLSSKKKSKTPVAFSFSGIFGMWVAEYLLVGASQRFIFSFIVVGFTLVSCAFSIGLIAYQKLYFIKKYNLYK